RVARSDARMPREKQVQRDGRLRLRGPWLRATEHLQREGRVQSAGCNSRGVLRHLQHETEARGRQSGRTVSSSATPEPWIWIVLAAVLLAVLWTVPRLQVRHLKGAAGVDAGERFTAENEARATLAQILGGLFLLIGAYHAWVQLGETRRSLDIT